MPQLANGEPRREGAAALRGGDGAAAGRGPAPGVHVFQPPLRTLLKERSKMSSTPLGIALDPGLPAADARKLLGHLAVEVLHAESRMVLQRLRVSLTKAGEVSVAADAAGADLIDEPVAVFRRTVVVRHKVHRNKLMLLLQADRKQGVKDIELRVTVPGCDPVSEFVFIGSKPNKRYFSDAQASALADTEARLQTSLLALLRSFEHGEPAIPYLDPGLTRGILPPSALQEQRERLQEVRSPPCDAPSEARCASVSLSTESLGLFESSFLDDLDLGAGAGGACALLHGPEGQSLLPPASPVSPGPLLPLTPLTPLTTTHHDDEEDNENDGAGNHCPEPLALQPTDRISATRTALPSLPPLSPLSALPHHQAQPLAELLRGRLLQEERRLEAAAQRLAQEEARLHAQRARHRAESESLQHFRGALKKFFTASACAIKRERPLPVVKLEPGPPQPKRRAERLATRLDKRRRGAV